MQDWQDWVGGGIQVYLITFHKFLELDSTLSEKKIFIMNFPFLTDSLKPLAP